MQNIFIHHVYFWLNNPGSKQDADLLIGGLRKLSSLKLIKQFHIGRPAGTSRDVVDNTYAVSWFVVFASAEDQDQYQTDAAHLAFVADCKHLWNRVVVYDTIDG